MLDMLRTRASLLFCGVVVFLLLLMSVPRWDAGWVQAIGSIAAIASGFGYVGLQHRWQRQDRKAKESAMRRHVRDIASSCVDNMDERLKENYEAAAKKQAMKLHTFRDGLDILADELLTVSPTDCDSSEVSSSARALGLHIKAFSHRAGEIAKTDAPPSAEDLLNLEDYVAEARKASNEISAESIAKGDPATR